MLRELKKFFAEAKNRFIRKSITRTRTVKAYERHLWFLRKHIKRKPSRIYYDYGLAEVLALLPGRPGTVLERLETRLQAWYRDRDPRFLGVAELVNKLVMREKIALLGVPLPELYFCGRDLSDLNVANLPELFVAKPHNGSDSKGVLVMQGDRDLLTGTVHDRTLPAFKQYLADYVLGAKGTNSQTQVMIEEYVIDAIDPLGVPLDYKAHCYGGQVLFFQVINRNPGQRSQSFYTRDWQPLPLITASFKQAYPLQAPSCLPELVRYADIVASDIKQMIRLDFYVSKRGPIFGEFTTFPAAGRNFTKYGNALCIQCWELFPDKPSLY